jgi:hypothetical protein
MLKCRIQWVNVIGMPTSDTNEATCLAVSVIVYANGAVQRREYPCCHEHAKQLHELADKGPEVVTDQGRELYTSQWFIEPLPKETP